ncbi:MAG: J domain-containing protein [Candidatus Hodarchaeales archaeon]
MTDSIIEAFRILGIKPPINISTLKTSFRTLAKIYHPDVNPSDDAEDRFKEIINAYEVVLEKLTHTNSITEEDLNDELNWFRNWKRRHLSSEDDPFEVLYEDYWMPKIAKMLKNMKKTKSS